MTTEDLIEKKAIVRLLELNFDPEQIKGTLDASHLKSIHAFIFQDSPVRKGGQFRTANYQDVHSKNRGIYLPQIRFFYHNAPTEEAVNEILQNGKRALSLATNTEEFANALTDIYAELDYQHPFVEGNSRTLRYFTELLAQSYGYDLNWNILPSNEHTFHNLYRARDYEVVKQNLKVDASNSEVEAHKLEELKRYQSKERLETQIKMNGGMFLNEIILLALN